MLLDTDSFSFIIFKRLYHTSSRLNIVNFSIALPPGPPEPIEGLTVCPDPQLRFISQFMQNAGFFSFLANALERQLINPPNLVNWTIFWTIWRTGAKFQALFKLATCSNCSITNYVKFTMFHFLEKVNKRELKMVYIDY